ncbi:MAG: phasin family protein [Bdellovibrionales bacterium]|nr:phasin family protein [Ramlibacter sp.]
MVTKMKKPSSNSDAKATSPFSGTVKESAQQIWLAGLGAFSKAQDEGGKVFESLVKDGVRIQRKTQAVAEEKISEATSKMASMATEISSKATGQWGKLEDIFEDRVAKAMSKLGVPSAKDIAALNARIDELGKGAGKAPAERKPAAKAAPAKKAPAKKAPAKKATRKPA